MDEQNGKIIAILLLSLFILIGLYFVFTGLFPARIEVEGNTVKIQKKSILPPFNYKTTTIPNIRIAVVDERISSRKNGSKNHTYNVELQSYDGKKYYINFAYSSNYGPKARLKDKINDALRGKPLEQPIEEKDNFFIIFGCIFMVAPLLMLLSALVRKKDKDETIIFKQQSINDDINNSIIK